MGSAWRWLCILGGLLGCGGAPRTPAHGDANQQAPQEPHACTGHAPPAPVGAVPRQLVQGRHLGSVSRVTFSKAGLLASVSEDGSTRIWDPMTRLGLAVFRDASALAGSTSVEWSEAGDRLATFRGDAWRWLSTDGLDQGAAADSRYSDMRLIGGKGPAAWLGWSAPSGSWFNRQGELAGNLVVPKGFFGAPTPLALAADGMTAAAVGDGQLLVWSLAEPEKPPRALPVPAKGWAVALAPHAELAVVASLDFSKRESPPPASYTVLDLTSAAAPAARPLEGQTRFARQLAVSRDGRLVAAAADDALRVWDLKSGKPAYRFETGYATRAFTSLDFSWDSRWLALGTNDGAVLLLDAESGRLQGELGAQPRLMLAAPVFQGSGTLLAPSVGHVTRWSLSTGAIAARQDLPQGLLAVSTSTTDGLDYASEAERGCPMLQTGVSFAHLGEPAPAADAKPEAALCLGMGERVAAYDAGSKRLLTVEFQGSGEQLSLRELPLAKSRPLGVLPATGTPELAAHGRLVLIRTHLGPAYVWDAQSGSQLARLGVPGRQVGEDAECAHVAALSDDGTLLATTCVDELAVRKLDGSVVYQVRGAESLVDQVRITALKFMPASSDLLLGHGDGSLSLYHEGKLVTKSASPGGAVAAISVRADARRIATFSIDGGLRVWGTSPLTLLTTFVEFLDDEYIAFTPAGAYSGTDEVSTRVGWVFQKPFEYFGFEQLAAAYHRPDVVMQRLGGQLLDVADLRRRPPALQIVDTKPDVAAATQQIKVRASSDTRVDSVRFFVEGRPVAARAVCQADATLQVPVPLLSGANKVTAVAFDDAGFASNPTFYDVPGPAAARRPKLYVVAVGVSKYPHLGDDFQLAVADADARALAEAFRAQAGPGKTYDSADVTLLTNSQVTPSSVEQAIAGLSRMAPEDVAVVALAGHGVRVGTRQDMVFLTSEIEAGKSGLPSTASAEKSGIGWKNIAATLARARGRVVLLLDACHSGHLSQDLIVQNQQLALELSRADRAGVIVFAAAKGRQFSYEPSRSRGLLLDAAAQGDVTSGDTGHGFFTAAVLNTLASADSDRNRDGSIQLSELVDAVSAKVSRATQGKQTPWVARREIFGDFQLVRSPAPKIAPHP